MKDKIWVLRYRIEADDREVCKYVKDKDRAAFLAKKLKDAAEVLGIADIFEIILEEEEIE